jgi:hypothetical protein
MRMVPIFAEEKYQLAFDRGIDQSKRAFAKLRQTTSYSPRDCPVSRAELMLAISDLLATETVARSRRLIIALVVIGAKMQWARLSGALMRKSGVVRLRDQMENGSGRGRESKR